jgi:ABC-type polar amino acid transport system ATPase subunit
MSVSVHVDGLELRRGARRVLAGTTFDVAPGEVVALMGQSGSGKTTILRTIAALESFQSGSVAVGDVTLAAGAWRRDIVRELRKRVGMVFQFHCLFEHLTVLENVCLAPVHAQRASRSDAAGRAAELLARLGVDHRAGALPRELSGGEAQRVAIARALAVDPPLLLMDEPTASLDARRRTELAGILKDLVSRNRTLILATHDEDFAAAVATRVLRVADGIVEPFSAAGPEDLP